MSDREQLASVLMEALDSVIDNGHFTHDDLGDIRADCAFSALDFAEAVLARVDVEHKHSETLEPVLSGPPEYSDQEIICANGSLRRLSDPVPTGAPGFMAIAPCEHCGHPGCFPGLRCIHCTVEIRLRALEIRA